MLYSRFQLAKKYLYYFFFASSGRGHGIHSPFVFNFIKKVLNDNTQYPGHADIEKHRAKLLADNNSIEVEDFGAGSTSARTNTRLVKDIASSSLKPKKYAQLLFRMVRHYQPATIVELGTSFGITSAYLSLGNKNARLITCEGAASIAAVARRTFDSLQMKNVELLQGDFARTLPSLFAANKIIDFIFIDGNHRKEATIEYFELFLLHSTHATIFVFDDIHWSRGMEEAWHSIQHHAAVTLTIDLFFIGLVFIDPGVKAPQHFVIRF